MSDIPFNDLSRTAEPLAAELHAAVGAVLRRGRFVRGEEHEAFEAELAAYTGAGGAALVGNGTDALELALVAVGVGRGDEVLTVANAGSYATLALRAIGATPVYCEVDAATLLATPELVEQAIARCRRTPAALVLTHLYGATVDLPALTALAAANGIPVVEDCAQALGARVGGRAAGSWGDAAAVSFYPTKNLGAAGDGGAVLARDPAVAEAVRSMRQYGWTQQYRIGLPHGRNSRMDELQAAVLRVKLPHLDGWNERRRELYARYRAACDLFPERNGEGFVAHLAVLVTEDRDAAADALAGHGIRTQVHYPVPDHLQGPTPSPQPGLAVTERLAGQVLSVPLFPELRDDEVARIEDALCGLRR